MTLTVNRKAATADRLMMALAVVLGAGSIALFAWDARPTFVPLGWPPRAALAWDAFLSLVFFVQHSGMVRRPFRARLARVLPARYDGAFYAISSGLTLLLVVVLWQRVDIPVFRLEGVARWIAMAGSLIAAALLVISGYAVRRTIDLLGLRPIRAHLRGVSPRSTPFFVAGPYRWVRHPLYACILALLLGPAGDDGRRPPAVDPLERLDCRGHGARRARPGCGLRRRVQALPAAGADARPLARPGERAEWRGRNGDVGPAPPYPNGFSMRTPWIVWPGFRSSL